MDKNGISLNVLMIGVLPLPPRIRDRPFVLINGDYPTRITIIKLCETLPSPVPVRIQIGQVPVNRFSECLILDELQFDLE